MSGPLGHDSERTWGYLIDSPLHVVSDNSHDLHLEIDYNHLITLLDGYNYVKISDEQILTRPATHFKTRKWDSLWSEFYICQIIRPNF